ncbi:hypothetical protein V8F06_009773 [Rhypophila decipiens]
MLARCLIRSRSLLSTPSPLLHQVKARSVIVATLTSPPQTQYRLFASSVATVADTVTNPHLETQTQSYSPELPKMEGVKSGPKYTSLAGRIHPQLLKGLEQMDYTHMTPVQDKVLNLPNLTDDCLVQAKTGTGKTIAFLLPALHNLLTSKKRNPDKVAILVLAPTRELAQQIAQECDRLTSQCQPPIECSFAVGGSGRNQNLKKFLTKTPTVLVATPGRFNDYLSEEAVRQKLDQLTCVVLDEADRMLDAGFLPELIPIFAQLPPKKTGNWQGMCFSATMPAEIHKVLHHVLKPGYATISTLSENDTPTVDAIPQTAIPVGGIEEVIPMLHKVLSCERIDNPSLKAIIFSSTARHAALMYQIFGLTGGAGPGKLPVFQMHSRMSQPARTRTVEEFKATDRGLLFASDVVGRGMDFPEIDLVVQVGLPLDKEQYVHRVGRTGRAGKTGRATMILIPEEMKFVRNNPRFPIKTITFDHPKATAIPSQEIIKTALERVDDDAKNKAYVAFIGFTHALKRVYGLEPRGVVKLANDFAELAMGMDEPPILEASTVGKMGLKGVPGLRISGKAGVPRLEKRPNGRSQPAQRAEPQPAKRTDDGNAGPSNPPPGRQNKKPRWSRN